MDITPNDKRFEDYFQAIHKYPVKLPNDEVRLIYSLPLEENKLTNQGLQQTMIVALLPAYIKIMADKLAK